MISELAIFDLGNVLFEANLEKAIRTWSNLSGVNEDLIRGQFDANENLEKFERGEVGAQDFFKGLNAQLGLGISYEEIIDGWNSIFGPVWHQNYKAICTIATVIQVVALTNTNSTHYPIWTRRYENELKVFEKIYVSSELGMRKPEPRIFNYVLKDCGVLPQKAIVFDDGKNNFTAARQLGIQAVLIINDSTLPKWMHEHKLS
jgi:putative hydrolase of the HAD superfamily